VSERFDIEVDSEVYPNAGTCEVCGVTFATCCSDVCSRCAL
jgi:hypothetical protein